ncbi:MAG: hypothetical protein K6F14_05680 [Clostridiales bacterium]|nr:hypothetical protein [Clostridiales bacterium]
MTKKEIITWILIVIICLCIVAILFSVALWLSSEILIGNLNSYNDFRVNGEYIDYLDTVSAKGKYYSFPRTMVNVKTINDYYISSKNGDDFSAFFDVSYDDEGFENEIARLNNLTIRSVSQESDAIQYKKMMYIDDESLFKYPTYVALYDGSRVEYVCIDNTNNRCVYVFIGNMLNNELELDEEFLPIYFQNKETNPDSSEFKYSIYAE